MCLIHSEGAHRKSMPGERIPFRNNNGLWQQKKIEEEAANIGERYKELAEKNVKIGTRVARRWRRAKSKERGRRLGFIPLGKKTTK